MALFLALPQGLAGKPPPHLQDLNAALLKAIKKHDLKAAEAALKDGADPNSRVPGAMEFYSPLDLATTEGSFALVELLLNWGADPYAEDEGHDQPLVYAAKKKKEQILRLFLSRGVPIDHRDSLGRTALERIIPSAQVEPDIATDIDLLIQIGADPKQRTSDGGNLLIPAIISDAVTALEEFVRHGVDINGKDDDGNTALLTAAYQSRDKCIEYLLKAGADVNAQNKHGDTALSMLAYWHSPLPDLILKCRPNVNLADSDGKTPLMKAVEGGTVERIKTILDLGADIRARDKAGEEVIHFAAGHVGWLWEEAKRAEERETQFKIVELLEQRGANVKAITNDGRSALHFAAATGYPGMVRWLMEKGCDPSKADKKGDTPLHHAIRSHEEGKTEKVKLLAKASVNAVNNDGDTPLLLAIAAMDQAACSLLLENGASVDIANKRGDTPLLLAASSFNRGFVKDGDYVAIVRMLAAKTSNMDARDRQGMTAAMWAAASNLPEALDAILARGADFKARSADGRTLLMWAASANAASSLELLLKRGADLREQDGAGRTATDWARLLNYQSAVEALGKPSAIK